MKPTHAKWLCFFLVLCVQRANSTIHQDILTWWKSISVQKPLNCQLNHEFTKPVPEPVSQIVQDKFRLPFVQWRKCGELEIIDYQFKGKMVNGVPDGPGKLKFQPLSEAESDEAKQNGQLCSSRYYFRGHVPKDIIGTFKNGKLIGKVYST